MAEHRPPDARTLRWLCGAVGPAATVVSTDRLVGGITAAMDRVVVRQDGTETVVVLRRWPTSVGHAPEMVEREAGTLTALAGRGIGAPELIAADPTGERTGAPALLMTEVPGRVELAPRDPGAWVRALAEQQATIHRLGLDTAGRDPEWFDASAERGWIADPGVRAEALAAASAPRVGERGFVHGDDQHFNVLWRDERISAVVDWPSSGMGDPAYDVGHCRLNLAVLFRPDAADDHRRHYEAAVGARLDVGGDLRALLCWAPVWQEFIPVQVAGRAPVDLDGMAARVTETIRRALRRG